MKQSHKSHCGLISAVLALSLALPSSADTIHVPGDYPTIQQAINAAAMTGDEIIVAPGTYREAINLQGKELLLRSSAGPFETTIDAAGLATSAITCTSGETLDTTIEGFTVTGGTGTQVDDETYGGAFYCVSSASTFQHCRIIDNTASNGGGFALNSNCIVRVTDCEFERNAGEWGGGVMVSYSDLTLIDCEFQSNEARFGGGVYMSHAEDSTISNCGFESNLADDEGGGMWHGFGIVTVDDCLFSSNRAPKGGALFTRGGSYGDRSIYANRTTFLRNRADIGGAVYNRYMMFGYWTECRFIENVSDGRGGAMYCDNDNRGEFTRCLFRRNWASSNGGALCSSSDTVLQFDASLFDNNHALEEGGAIWFAASSPLVFSCVFTRNSSAMGGAILGVSTSPREFRPTIRNCTFVANHTDSGAGTSIAFRPASEGDGGVASITNSILQSGGDELEILDSTALLLTCCNINGGYDGLGNFDLPSMFVDAGEGDFRLRPGSPCIDAGNNAGIPPDSVDFNGNDRFVDSPYITDTGQGNAPVIDIGACEFQADAHPELTISPQPLVQGEMAEFTITNARRGTRAYLAYSLAGPGAWYVPSLNVYLDISLAFRVPGSYVPDRDGRFSGEFPVPPNAAGREMWFQFAQENLKSIVVQTSVE